MNRNDHIAVISSFEAQDVNFEEDKIQIGLHTSEVAVIAIIPFNTDWNPAYDPIPVSQDQVGTIISSVSNTLDPLYFYNALKNDQAKSELKMSIRATSTISLDESDYL